MLSHVLHGIVKSHRPSHCRVAALLLIAASAHAASAASMDGVLPGVLPVDSTPAFSGRTNNLGRLATNPVSPMTTVPGSSQGLVDRLRLDARGVFSTRTLGILTAGGALAILGTSMDEPNRAARAVEQPGFDEGSDFGNTYGSLAVIGGGTVALMTAGRILGNDNVSGAGGDMARALFLTTAITTPLKVGVGRTRPNGGKYSFPSGHSALAFAAAPVVASHFGGKLGTLAYLAAVATAMGRVEEHKHYVSDVVFGAAVGLSVGLAVSSGPHSSVPGLVVNNRGVGLGVHF